MGRSSYVNQLLHHGWARVQAPLLSPLCLEAAYADWTRFFLQPGKEAFRPLAGRLDGYFQRGIETAKGAESPDLKEFFHFNGYDRCPNYCYPSTSPIFEYLADLAVDVFAEISTEISDLEVFTRGLRNSRRLVMRIAFYKGNRNASCFAAPHEDINFLTLLPRATSPGLEVLEPDGKWFPVHGGYHECVLLAGDMIAEASKGALRATRHCVSPSVNDRLSLSFFLNPDDHIVLSDRWTADEFLMHRLREIGIKR